MFESDIYVQRRELLKKELQGGIVLFLGNGESPMNYADNPYSFRQDSTFLYYFGLDTPGLAAIMDIDEDLEIFYGYDYTVDDIVWMGPQLSLQERAERVGIKKSAPEENLTNAVTSALNRGRLVHVLPPYRDEHRIKIASLLHLNIDTAEHYVSEPLIKAVVAQRSVKSAEEIGEIEKAIDITYEMHTFAMQHARPGMLEREISGKMAGIAAAYGSSISFPIIFSVHGETLHNHYHGNVMQAGDLVVNDSGAESLLHYAGDITRTIPIGGHFSKRQRDIYEIVLAAQKNAINAIRPGIAYRDIHLQSARDMADGLKQIGLMRGDIKEAVAVGAHALFFPHGLGHMLGLDVHDMENLGENVVGYDATIQRSSQFGLKSLRLAKALQPGYVLTVEPGLYFIPALIEKWQSDKKFVEFINYDNLKDYMDFGGIRIEDDVLVTQNGSRVLGKPIPKTVDNVEALASA
ncbi:aminopeptidase P family protein [candidate division KSB1 bacterium]|nr:aminopeptidase P family protein [candidate division KSB1 bacterium]RQW05102.1 MAG: aminopeptidase P family protein [candidate division KSB1 bacterium]